MRTREMHSRLQGKVGSLAPARSFLLVGLEIARLGYVGIDEWCVHGQRNQVAA
jgi:hypothetical protein